jgi:hypothetical protein
MEQYLVESRAHGWPSFRDAEVSEGSQLNDTCGCVQFWFLTDIMYRTLQLRLIGNMLGAFRMAKP